ncbi:hypothetical protein PtA15_14A256 [Puccinia triticina]|uniref:Rho-GAP domain-containing protein n=1 Tax=Puccinia triticina TaxID=208348 RepID=A0ABY7D1C1_9BASI|nr:uncharacterized protein PtA15_14A256 [Puccinia triticina]WAQ91373.1 hypothetical protein PtA15_14A256 [Puccinia triticina]
MGLLDPHPPAAKRSRLSLDGKRYTKLDLPRPTPSMPVKGNFSRVSASEHAQPLILPTIPKKSPLPATKQNTTRPPLTSAISRQSEGLRAPGAASSNGREPVKIIFMPPSSNASTADSGSTLLSPLKVIENPVPMRTCDLTPGANHQVTTGSAPALDAANPLEPAPTQSQSTPAASQSRASDPQAACDASRKKKLDELMTGIEVFRRPITKKGLLCNIDELEILKDEMELHEGLALITSRTADNSPLFLPIVKEVIAYRVKNHFDNGGFWVGTFKLKKSSPELLALPL